MEVSNLKEKYFNKIETFNSWTNVNIKELDVEMSKNASRLNHVGNNKATAEFLMNKLKLNLDKLKADIRRLKGSQKIEGKKLTNALIDAYVDGDESVLELAMQYIEAKYVYSLCDVAFSAIKEKGQQLLNLSYNKRAELTHKYTKESA